MDAFNFAEDPKQEKPKPNPGNLLLKLGTYYFLISSVVLAGFFILIYINPYTPLNPWMPPPPTATAPSLSAQPTSTTAPQVTFTLAPTAAQSLEPSAEASSAPATPTPTFIPYPTPTNVVLATSGPLETSETLPKYSARQDTPSYIAYSGGCSGVYLAGNVTDSYDRPVVLLTVRATGTIGGQPFEIEVLSGSNTNYSESGWEIKLSDQLIDSSGTITVGLYAQGRFDPVSDLVGIETYNDCSRNLAVVNFVQQD